MLVNTALSGLCQTDPRCCIFILQGPDTKKAGAALFESRKFAQIQG